MSQSVVKRMAEQEVKVKITPAAIEVIGKVGFDPEYGARPPVGPCKRSGRSFK